MLPNPFRRPSKLRPSRKNQRFALFELLERRELFAGDGPGLAGRGQDLLLVVNPNDENALRIAGEYRELRNIPDRNIVFVTPPEFDGFTRLNTPAREFWDDYVDQIHSAIEDRGLHDQIDMIAAVGQTHSFSEGLNFQSLSYGLMQLDQYQAGMTIPQGQLQSVGTGSKPNVTALRHSDQYEIGFGAQTQTHQYYVAGFLGISNQLGNSVDDIIEGLRRSVAADGTHPEGTIYFEENSDIRTTIREPGWDAAQDRLTALGIPFIQEQNVPGSTPQNRDDVRGGVIGNADAMAPNGSIYLPGAWVDNLTSYGGNFTSQNQTKATEFIAAGAAASSGTVAEPGPASLRQLAARFPDASIFEAIDAGVTLGEAYYHAVEDPDMLQFIGDLLAQPYANIPVLEIGVPIDAAIAPDELGGVGGFAGLAGIAVPATLPGSPIQHFALPKQQIDHPVSGRIRWNASATVAGGDIAKLELFIDGQLKQTIESPTGDFIIDTRDLSDGVHEFRFVAVADHAAETEGIVIQNVAVHNLGRSIKVADYGSLTIADKMVSIGITTEGAGSIDRIELRHLGRVIASAGGDVTELTIDLDQLAYYDNQLVPVAVFSDGMEVMGSEFTLRREPNFIEGRVVSTEENRTMGIRAEYFFGRAQTSIADTDFSGTPDLVELHSSTHLSSRDLGRPEMRLATDAIDGLAIRLTGSFDVSEQEAGEFTWSALNTNDSLRFSVDGQVILAYDDKAFGSNGSDASGDAFLAAGRHDFEILLANQGTANNMNLELLMRGSDGKTRPLSEAIVYQANGDGDTTPEPPSTPEPPTTPEPPSTPGSPNPAGLMVDFESEDMAVWTRHLNAGYSYNQDSIFTEIYDGTNIQLVETDLAFSGDHALQLQYRDNEDRALAVVHLDQTLHSDFIRTSQMMRFSAEHDFAYGQKIHQIVSFDPSTQNNHFGLVINAWGAPQAGRVDGDMTGVNGSRFVSINYAGGPFDWGSAMADFEFQRERWYEITAEVQLNTPGQADGYAQLFIDGELIAEKQGIEIRENETQQFNQVSFGGWYSNGAAGANPALAPAAETMVLIDDVSVVTSPTDSNAPDPNEPVRLLDVSPYEESLQVQEGGPSGQWLVALTAQPAGEVTVSLQSSDPDQLTFSTDTLTFNSENWHLGYFVDAIAIDDDVAEVSQTVEVTLSVVTDGSDSPWHDTPAVIRSVVIMDNDENPPPPGGDDLPTGPLVGFDIVASDASGDPITSIEVGDQFIVEIYTQSLQSDDGVFSAILDVVFDPTLIEVNGEIQYGELYPNLQVGDTSTAGLIDELGALSGVGFEFGRRSLLARVPMIAIGEGTVLLQTDPSEQQDRGEVTLFNIDEVIPTDQITYGSTSLSVRNQVAPWHNSARPTDVNGDGTTSPIDALRIINLLNRNRGGSLSSYSADQINGYVDVNRDGHATAIDALMVINDLNSRESTSASEPLTAGIEHRRIDADAHDRVLAELESSPLF